MQLMRYNFVTQSIGISQLQLMKYKLRLIIKSINPNLIIKWVMQLLSFVQIMIDCNKLNQTNKYKGQQSYS